MAETADDIYDQAAQFALLAHGGWEDPVAEADCRAWLERDSRHRGAFARAQAAILLVRSASGEAGLATDAHGVFAAAAPAATAALSRRRVLLGSAATLLTAVGIGATLLAPKAQAIEYRTGVGEQRRLLLDGGADLLLDANSLLRCSQYGPGLEMTLLTGAAFLSLPPSSRTPVALIFGSARITASSATLLVRNKPAVARDVSVMTGSVTLAQERKSSTIGAGHRIREGSHRVLETVPVSADELAMAAAWKEGLIYFRDTPLAAAVRAFADYSHTRIEFADPEIGAMRISGQYPIGRPRSFADAVALSLRLRAVQGRDAVTLEKKI